MLETFNIDWAANKNVHALTTTRLSGQSRGVYDSLNLGRHVDDDPGLVDHNRALIKHELNLPSQPKWLNQVHGINIVQADSLDGVVDADGSYTKESGCVCAVLTADCLPVFLSDISGSCVGVFHAGWRGLANGMLRAAVNSMNTLPDQLIAAIGPSISQSSFRVGEDVKTIFETKFASVSAFFVPAEIENYYYADLYGLAQAQLTQLGINNVWLPESVCTFEDVNRFYSFRRDGQTGRMASLIWISRHY